MAEVRLACPAELLAAPLMRHPLLEDDDAGGSGRGSDGSEFELSDTESQSGDLCEMSIDLGSSTASTLPAWAPATHPRLAVCALPSPPWGTACIPRTNAQQQAQQEHQLQCAAAASLVAAAVAGAVAGAVGGGVGGAAEVASKAVSEAGQRPPSAEGNGGYIAPTAAYSMGADATLMPPAQQQQQPPVAIAPTVTVRGAYNDGAAEVVGGMGGGGAPVAVQSRPLYREPPEPMTAEELATAAADAESVNWVTSRRAGGEASGAPPLLARRSSSSSSVGTPKLHSAAARLTALPAPRGRRPPPLAARTLRRSGGTFRLYPRLALSAHASPGHPPGSADARR